MTTDGHDSGSYRILARHGGSRLSAGLLTRLVLLAGLVLVGVATATLLPGGPETAVQPPTQGNGAPGVFDDVTVRAGIDFRHHAADGAMDDVLESIGTGAVVFDYDGDGDIDLFVFRDGPNHFYRNRGAGRFEEMAVWAGGAYGFHGEATGAMAGVVGDVNLDGRPDLSVTDTHYGSLFCNACLADFDDDGRMDVLLTMIEGPSVLLRGCKAVTGTWVKFVLRGTLGALHGQGARVTVRAGGRSWVQWVHVPSGYLAQNDPRLHFGLGACEQVESVTVRWPSGRKERFDGCVLNRVQDLVEGQGVP